MPDQQPHARAFDLPGWSCPPRVRDIANHQESWGWVLVSRSRISAVGQDELGYLWADGDAVPVFQTPSSADANPGAIACWTEHGLGLRVHPKSLQHIQAISRLDMTLDRWVPIAVALHELPAFVKAGA